MFTYDNRGNITSRKHYNYTVNTPSGTPLETINYTYKTSGFTDILTKVGGVTYSNDAIGNRTSDGTWTYTWEHGRQLASMSKTGTAITYAYGADGYRIGKSVTENNTTVQTEYYYRDGQLIEMISGSDHMHFFYNANGTPISVLYNNTRYYYVRNAQGDIVALTTVSGQKAVAYAYDAWGRLLDITGPHESSVGQANPLRYRGYVYDSETGLYYLGSRYYDPAVGRFINADAYISTGQNMMGYNMFAYCANNPINRMDPSGRFWCTVFFVVIAAVCAGTLSGCSEPPTSDIGAAKPYVEVPGSEDPNSPNCYAYAIGSPKNEQPGETSGRKPKKWNDVYDVGKSVEADLIKKGVYCS